MRYTGPKLKLCRREGVNLFGTEKYDLSTNNRKRLGGGRGKTSEYGIQLRKKQTAKRMYGLSEKQFARIYQRASAMSMITGDAMLQLLERRLDTVVYRANFGRTMMQARQCVNHAHFLVNGKKVDIPSYEIKVGDVITLRERLKESALYKTLVEEFASFIEKNKSGSVTVAKWISVDAKKLSITIDRLPQHEDFDASIDTSRIIEFYSK